METSHLVILAILLGCMATYVPVYMCLFFTAVLGFIFFTDLPILLLAQTIFRSMDNFALVVVLMRVLVGVRTSGTFMPILIALAVWHGDHEDRNGRKVVSVWERLIIMPPKSSHKGC